MDADADYRVGDPERDQALQQLREHAAQGRLTPAEFEQRVEQVLRARTRGELAAPFGDLPPVPVPAGGVVAAATTSDVASGTTNRAGGWNWRLGVSSAAMPAAVVACIATDWRYWWIMMVPLVVSSLLWAGRDDDPDDEPQDEPEPALDAAAATQLPASGPQPPAGGTQPPPPR